MLFEEPFMMFLFVPMRLSGQEEKEEERRGSDLMEFQRECGISLKRW